MKNDTIYDMVLYYILYSFYKVDIIMKTQSF